MTPAKALAERLHRVDCEYGERCRMDDSMGFNHMHRSNVLATAALAWFREQRPTRERLQDIAANEIPNGPTDSHEIRVRAGFIADAILALWDVKEREG